MPLEETVTITFTENGEQSGPPYNMAGLTLLKSLRGDYNQTRYVEPIKDIQAALSRAIEEGDSLKIGIVLGQTLRKLDELINQ